MSGRVGGENQMGREYQRSRREYLRFNNRCVRCGTKDGRTESGWCHCEACAKENKENTARLREYRRSAGCCVRCGGKDERTERGLCYCAGCNKKHTEYYRGYREREKHGEL